MCQVFHGALPLYFSDELERIQLRPLEEIYPNLGYQEALQECSITTLNQWRKQLTERLFK